MSSEGEEQLQQKFLYLVKNDFAVFPQVTGRHLIHQEAEERIDFLLFPKEHLIEKGFDPVWFGVEVKHFDAVGETGKMSRFICQCISYAQSEFIVDGQTIRPTFILGFSNVEEINKNVDNDAFMQWLGMLRLSGLLKVGMFHEIKPKSYNPNGGWNIVFSSSMYFRFSKGKYEKKDYNVFKINIGNCIE